MGITYLLSSETELFSAWHLMSPMRQLMFQAIASQALFCIMFLKGGEILKIEINVDENMADMEITITCKKLTPKVEKLLATLRMMDSQMIGRKNNEIHLLDIARIIYIESVERKCFVYTADEVYESEFPLYELEQQLAEYGFFRVSKSFLIHLQSILSLKADINRRIRITMSNGEQIIASRQYADELKKRLGVK